MMGMKNQSLLTDRNAVYWFQTLITQWKSVGWSSIIYIAAVAGIDQELYEAAYVDGAGRLRCALSITLPSLLPTFTVMMLLNISNLSILVWINTISSKITLYTIKSKCWICSCTTGVAAGRLFLCLLWVYLSPY